MNNQTYSLKRIVGKGRGRDMGIPTINFRIPKNISVSHGIYAGWFLNNDKKYKAAIHFGPVPQFNQNEPSLEAYILDGSIGQLEDTPRLEFVRFIRDVKRFTSTGELITQIDKDIEQINTVLNQE